MLSAAGSAPGGPKVEHDYFAEERGKCKFVSIRTSQGKGQRILELTVGIVLAECGAAISQLLGGLVVGFQNQITEAGFGAVELAVQFAQVRAVIGAVYIG